MAIHIFNRGNKKIKRLPLYTFMQTIVVSVKVSHADMALLKNKEHGYVFLFIIFYISIGKYHIQIQILQNYIY